MHKDLFGALANPYRREILRLLRWQSLPAGDICAHFSIAQPSVSRHLDILKKAELVTCERRGTQMIYSLNLSAAQEALLFLTELAAPVKQEEKGGVTCEHP